MKKEEGRGKKEEGRGKREKVNLRMLSIIGVTKRFYRKCPFD
ncbi:MULTISPECIES: hypothetical protein [unclassified Okeania]|nr:MULTISPECIES: hypothetical protein [unclassified Okeania]